MIPCNVSSNAWMAMTDYISVVALMWHHGWHSHILVYVWSLLLSIVHSSLTLAIVDISVSVRQGREVALMEEGEAPSERTYTLARLELSPTLLTSSCLAGRGER